MVGLLRRSFISSISWLMGVCIFLLSFQNCIQKPSSSSFSSSSICTDYYIKYGTIIAARCLIFIFRHDIQELTPEVRIILVLITLTYIHKFIIFFLNMFFCQIYQHMLLDLPSLAFFTTYALLILFWAEIYYQV